VGQSKGWNIVVWVLQVLLAVLFILASSGKLTGNPQVVEMFEGWGYPAAFMLLIGVLELAGAVGLLIPKTAGHAAMGLIGLMIGAAATHIAAGEGLQVLRPIIFMVPLVAIVLLRRPWPLKSAPA
jgi:uncharacterized membrane protein YphA (DoxX/SURF4 family)